jgi:predicted extracellular nuclease
VPKYHICQIILFGICLPFLNLYGQEGEGIYEIPTESSSNDYPHLDSKESIVRFVFYNVENLFHPSDDSIKIDEAFTPGGEYYWTYKRYYSKINKLGKLFVAIGEGCMPAIIGLCEIENYKVLTDILNKSVMKYCSYKAIHKESPDMRGIDVGLLYDPSQFKVLKYDHIRITDPQFPDLRTREILYVSGIIYESVQCHVFINHWPSRRGGQLASEAKRIIAAKKLKQFVDSLMSSDPLSNIIIMGDFNDEPINRSIKEILKAGDPDKKIDSSMLGNLMYPLFKRGYGTHYRVNNITEAAVLDQIIVSPSMLYEKNEMKIEGGKGYIYQNEFLMDKKNGRPLRTYQGLKYLGGFSDHLPVYADFQIVIK